MSTGSSSCIPSSSLRKRYWPARNIRPMSLSRRWFSYHPIDLPMLCQFLDLEVQCIAALLDHARGSTCSNLHYIGTCLWILPWKARLMILLELISISQERAQYGDHSPHSVEYPSSNAKCSFSRQVQLACNDKYIEWSPKMIVVMERTKVDIFGHLDFWELQSSRSSNSAESFSSPPSCLYACFVVAIFFGFVTILRDAKFVAHGIANVRDVLGWGVQWWMIWLHSVWLLLMCSVHVLLSSHSAHSMFRLPSDRIHMSHA